eukprot:1903125-Amphidinium_carterae.1
MADTEAAPAPVPEQAAEMSSEQQVEMPNGTTPEQPITSDQCGAELQGKAAEEEEQELIGDTAWFRRSKSDLDPAKKRATEEDCGEAPSYRQDRVTVTGSGVNA